MLDSLITSKELMCNIPSQILLNMPDGVFFLTLELSESECLHAAVSHGVHSCLYLISERMNLGKIKTLENRNNCSELI